MINKIIMYILIFVFISLILNHFLNDSMIKEGMDNSCKGARRKLLSQKKKLIN